jgi:hypothetical protein
MGQAREVPRGDLGVACWAPGPDRNDQCDDDQYRRDGEGEARCSGSEGGNPVLAALDRTARAMRRLTA